MQQNGQGSALGLGMSADATTDIGSSSSAGAKQSIAAAQESIQKALDCQAFVVSLFAKSRPSAHSPGLCVDLQAG